jgi:hypothetical protein
MIDIRIEDAPLEYFYSIIDAIKKFMLPHKNRTKILLHGSTLPIIDVDRYDFALSMFDIEYLSLSWPTNYEIIEKKCQNTSNLEIFVFNPFLLQQKIDINDNIDISQKHISLNIWDGFLFSINDVSSKVLSRIETIRTSIPNTMDDYSLVKNLTLLKIQYIPMHDSMLPRMIAKLQKLKHSIVIVVHMCNDIRLAWLIRYVYDTDITIILNPIDENTWLASQILKYIMNFYDGICVDIINSENFLDITDPKEMMQHMQRPEYFKTYITWNCVLLPFVKSNDYRDQNCCDKKHHYHPQQ